MDLTFEPHELAFRDELRRWLAANPIAPQPTGENETFAWRRDWQRTLHSGGWAGPHWPARHGGRDATITQSAIYFEELGRARRPRAAGTIGIIMGGPTLMVWGTEEQQERHLGPILSGDEIWCQGFSEPGAGSDLAAVSTRAVRDGDTWVVSGQKVWTSYAQHAKWCMLLTRTDRDAPKHKGLTYFLLDMELEGVTVKPLRQITGESDFNELFLDEVRIPHEHMVGPEGAGWKVALTTLMNERAGLGMSLQVQLRQFVDDLFEAARANGQIEDPRIADELADLHLCCEASRLMAWRSLTDTERHGQPGPQGSLVKLVWSQTNQRATQLAIDIVGPEALLADSRWAYELLRARGNSIEGGTTEILKNIVAERVLGLPRMPIARG